MLTAVVFGFAAGLLALLFGPTILGQTRLRDWAGNAWFSFVAKALQRPAVSVGDHGSPSLVQLSYDAIYEEDTVERDGVEKKITRVEDAVHRVGTAPFTFVDEKFGVMFDLRDVLFGELEHQHREDGEMIYRHTEYNDDGEPIGSSVFWRSFVEVSERQGLSLDLKNSVRPLIDGNEEADWWEDVYEATRRMYVLKQDDITALKTMVPFISGAIALFVGYYVFGPGPMPWASGSNEPDPVTVGTLLLPAALGPVRDRVREAAGRIVAWLRSIDWLEVAKAVGLALLVGGVVWASVLAGPVTALAFWGGAIVGFGLLPVLGLVLGALGAGVGLAELLLWAGFQAFEQPTINLEADDRYRVREATALGLESPPVVRLANTWVALSCDVDAEAWGRAGYDAAAVAAYQDPNEIAADGGPSLPTGLAPSDRLLKANKKGLVPTDLDSSATYVRVDTALRRFKDAATGDAIDTAHREATKEFAAGDPQFTDRELMKYSGLAAIGGFGFWVVIGFAF